MHILLADDRPKVRFALRLLLEQQPEAHVVEEVAGGQALLEQLRNSCPDVLLLDWELPGLPPRQLLATIKQEFPGIFTVVLDSKPQTGQHAIQAGADEFVSKNDPPERLIAAIERVEI